MAGPDHVCASQHVGVCVSTTSERWFVRAHACVERAGSRRWRSDTPPLQSGRRQDVFLFHLPQMSVRSLNHLKPELNTSSRSLSKHGAPAPFFLMGSASGCSLWGWENLWFECSSGANNSSSDVKGVVWLSKSAQSLALSNQVVLDLITSPGFKSEGWREGGRGGRRSQRRLKRARSNLEPPTPSQKMPLMFSGCKDSEHASPYVTFLIDSLHSHKVAAAAASSTWDVNMSASTCTSSFSPLWYEKVEWKVMTGSGGEGERKKKRKGRKKKQRALAGAVQILDQLLTTNWPQLNLETPQPWHSTAGRCCSFFALSGV